LRESVLSSEESRNCSWCHEEVTEDEVKEGGLFFHRDCYVKFTRQKEQLQPWKPTRSPKAVERAGRKWGRHKEEL